MSIEQTYVQRLTEKDSDYLFVELAEARRADALTAVVLIEAELRSRGLRIDQRWDNRQEG